MPINRVRLCFRLRSLSYDWRIWYFDQHWWLLEIWYGIYSQSRRSFSWISFWWFCECFVFLLTAWSVQTIREELCCLGIIWSRIIMFLILLVSSWTNTFLSRSNWLFRYMSVIPLTSIFFTFDLSSIHAILFEFSLKKEY